MPQLDGDHRLDLLERATIGVSGLRVDDRELRRSGPSYMVDTLASLRAEFPHRSLCLILGLDAFLGLPAWHRWQELANYAHIIIMDRPGSRLPKVGELAEWLRLRRTDSKQTLHERLAGAAYCQTVTQLDISATHIRRRLAAGRSVRFLVPDAVLQAIVAQGLYSCSHER
jgi:nicotinate-nucleotide adenylyltransferase